MAANNDGQQWTDIEQWLIVLDNFNQQWTIVERGWKAADGDKRCQTNANNNDSHDR